MNVKFFIVIILGLIISSPSYAAIGAGHVTGKITNITSINSGLLIRVGSNEVPQNCTSGDVWMEIKQEKTAIASLTLTAWTLGRHVTVYTSPGVSGFCQVIQVDPTES